MAARLDSNQITTPAVAGSGPGWEDRRATAPGWRDGWAYTRAGLGSLRAQWSLALRILLVYAAPALVAALLAATRARPAPWEQFAIAGLPWITAVLGTVVVMIAVSRQAHGQPVGVWQASREALPWVPRYLWTNAHTSLIFWLPVWLLTQARDWQAATWSLPGPLGFGVATLWWLVVALVALAVHTRTLLAPFLAVHGNLPGSLAALEAWRLSGRHFGACCATFVLAGLPVAALLGAGWLVLGLVLGQPAAGALQAATPALAWAGIQAVRPLLVPALYALYTDLWRAETVRRQRDGAPTVPAVIRLLLALTRPLPGRASS
jgi:hypothetical protein